MEVAVVLEQRFFRTHDGKLWTLGPFARPYWDRYLTVFDGVSVVARAEVVDELPEGSARVDGRGVRAGCVPHYKGPLEFARRWPAVRSALVRELQESRAVILRSPGTLSNMVMSLIPKDRAFGVEVVGDPKAVFARGIKHPLHLVLGFWFARALREQCQRASVACYVTEWTLQERYPPSPSAFTTHYSSIDLDLAGFAEKLPAINRTSPFRVVTVGSLEQPYKGVDVLVEALADCRKEMDVRLEVVGDGAHRVALERQVRELGLEASVAFHGSVPGPSAVAHILGGADLFVLASRAEGLPRVLVEAMALGLPCVATSVGGIPELLPAEYLVPPDASRQLATMIQETLADPSRRAAMARRNLAKAREYRPEALSARRNEAYQHLAATTAGLRTRQ